jgi:hypothetical protein
VASDLRLARISAGISALRDACEVAWGLRGTRSPLAAE